MNPRVLLRSKALRLGHGRLPNHHLKLSANRYTSRATTRIGEAPIGPTSASASATNTHSRSHGGHINGHRCFATRKQLRIEEAQKKKEKSSNTACDGNNGTDFDYGNPKTGLQLPTKSGSASSRSSSARSEELENPQLSVLLDETPLEDLKDLSVREDEEVAAAAAAAAAASQHLTQFHVNPNSSFMSPLSPSSMPASLSASSMSPPSPLEQQSSLSDMVDIASLYDPKVHSPNAPNFSAPGSNYEEATDLGSELLKYMSVTGRPISVMEYMKRCLRDELFGYYTQPPAEHEEEDGDGEEEDGVDDEDDDGTNDTLSSTSTQGRGHRLIGPKGDFTTAPEISQIFGECLLIWLLIQYQALGKPSAIQLIELGPGRGTLICDILRSAAGIQGVGQEFLDALTLSTDATTSKIGDVDVDARGVHLVEVGENLRRTQQEALEELQQQLQQAQLQAVQSESNSNLMEFQFQPWTTKQERQTQVFDLVQKVREQKQKGQVVNEQLLTNLIQEQSTSSTSQEDQGGVQQPSTESRQQETNKGGGIPIHWHDSFDSIPFTSTAPTTNGNGDKIPVFVICQEFVDALPVHVFQKTQQGWRERLVDIVVQDENDPQQEQVQVQMKDGTTHTAKTSFVPSSDSKSKASTDTSIKKKPRFRFVSSPEATLATQSLLHVNEDGQPKSNDSPLNDAPIGSILEVCPEALSIVQDIASRIKENEGAALIIDYGNEGSRDTLRAFKRHEQVNVLSSPGTVDLTADVDFAALKNAINNNTDNTDKDDNAPMAFGPKMQGEFLASMGAVERTMNLIENDNTTDEQAEELATALERLVSTEEMGERFKVMSIARKKDDIFPPAGF